MLVSRSGDVSSRIGLVSGNFGGPCCDSGPQLDTGTPLRISRSEAPRGSVVGEVVKFRRTIIECRTKCVLFLRSGSILCIYVDAHDNLHGAIVGGQGCACFSLTAAVSNPSNNL